MRHGVKDEMDQAHPYSNVYIYKTRNTAMYTYEVYRNTNNLFLYMYAASPSAPEPESGDEEEVEGELG